MVKEKKNELESIFHLKFRMGGFKVKLETSNNTEQKFDVNTDAVSGAILTGIGFSNLNELNASMDLPLSMSFGYLVLYMFYCC